MTQDKKDFIEAMLTWFRSPKVGKDEELDRKFLASAYDNITQPHWISVEDELPPTSDKDDESDDYLIVDSDGDMNVGYYNKMDKLWFSCDGHILDVTHWMPMPQAPLVTDLNKKDLPPVSWQEGNILVEEEGGKKMDFFTWKERYEYYRTKGYEQGYEDAINKACEWLDCYIDNYLFIDAENKAGIKWDDFINDFRKAMKGDEE